ncbi:hypothetical protein BBF96_02740 [Anoxybacter fermentans]|uniref:LysM domain-containing protein n=2 Tax=Anoxybacter fermentans TaxID=1323375 RepID=A0A3S9T2Q2_9FIRM|nr:hypothetical protein BBF96_02740 [Anoxybacter fermentans]
MTRFLYILIIVFSFSLFVSSPLVVAGVKPVFRLVYIVQEGDNLTTIAKKFKTTVSLLKKANKLTDKSILLPGDELFIPFDDESFEQKIEWPDTTLYSNSEPEFKIMDWQEYPVRIKQDPIKVNIPKSQRVIYHVKKGDSLYTLAREFNTTVAVIKALNNLESSIIRIGQQLILPTIGLTPKQVLAKTITPYELNLLARVVHGESRGEPYLGKVAVAAVILNRVLSPHFPNTIEDVIYQPGQFESVSNGQFNLHPTPSAYKAAREALNGFDPTLGALYFINPRVAKNTWWFKQRQKTVTIGNHVFAK